MSNSSNMSTKLNKNSEHGFIQCSDFWRRMQIVHVKIYNASDAYLDITFQKTMVYLTVLWLIDLEIMVISISSKFYPIKDLALETPKNDNGLEWYPGARENTDAQWLRGKIMQLPSLDQGWFDWKWYNPFNTWQIIEISWNRMHLKYATKKHHISKVLHAVLKCPDQHGLVITSRMQSNMYERLFLAALHCVLPLAHLLFWGLIATPITISVCSCMTALSLSPPVVSHQRQPPLVP